MTVFPKAPNALGQNHRSSKKLFAKQILLLLSKNIYCWCFFFSKPLTDSKPDLPPTRPTQWSGLDETFGFMLVVCGAFLNYTFHYKIQPRPQAATTNPQTGRTTAKLVKAVVEAVRATRAIARSRQPMTGAAVASRKLHVTVHISFLHFRLGQVAILGFTYNVFWGEPICFDHKVIATT